MVICVGEILADMIAKPTEDGIVYSRHAGGAPFNVACDIARLGGSAGFYGCVGNDLIGKFLCGFANKRGLKYKNIKTIDDRNTTLAFVDLDENGDRNFCFYRKNTADYCLDVADIPEIVKKADIVNIGSLPMSEECGRQFYRELIKAVKAAGKKIVFDVNFREDVFPDKKKAVEIYGEFVEAADIVKFSQDEIFIFESGKTHADAAKKLAKNGKSVFVTLGGEGSLYCKNGELIKVGAIPVKPVDTTGAGDAYFAGVLSVLDRDGFDGIKKAMLTGSVCGSLTTLKKGAIEAFPFPCEVEKRIDEISQE